MPESYVVLADAEFDAGTWESAGIVMPEDASYVRIRMERHGWPSHEGKSILHCRVWASYRKDKYGFLIGFTAGAAPENECWVCRKLKPQYKTNPRKVKVSVDFDVPLHTRIIAEFW